MSGDAELLHLAEKIVAQARAGEQIEAYVGRARETEIRVYEGEVENFTSALSEGIGIRVIRDGRTGFAYAGTLDGTAIDDVLADARDNVAFGTPDEWSGLAEPDGVAVQPMVLWNEALVVTSTARKIDVAKELERRSGASACWNAVGVQRTGERNAGSDRADRDRDRDDQRERDGARNHGNDADGQ